MQMCMLMKERDKAIKTRADWCRKKTDSCLSAFLNAVLWNCLTVLDIEGSHQLGRNLENVTSRSPLNRASGVSMGHTSKMF